MIFVPTESVFATDMSMDAFAGSFVSVGVCTAQFRVGEPIKPRAGQRKVGDVSAAADRED